MTDKQEPDQNMATLREAFKRLNKSEDLQPPEELDAMILHLAAGEELPVNNENTQNATQTEDNTVSDLSFRRERLRQAQDAQKKKPLFPVWAMPVGLAATVLLSFGVVNRVLQSPEFLNPVGNEQSATVFNDNQEVAEDFRSLAKADQDEDVYAGNAVPSVSQPQMKTSELIADQQASAPENELSSKDAMANAMLQDPAPEESDNSLADKTSSPERLSVASEEIQEDIDEVSTEETMQEPQAGIESKKMRAGVVSAPQTVSIAAEPAEAYSVESRSDEALAKNTPEALPTLTESEMPPVVAEAVAEPEQSISNVNVIEDDTIQAIGKINEAADTKVSSAVDVGSVSGQRQELNTLTAILLGHKECQVSLDCALVALECDACDCLEAVNRSNLEKYDSEFSVSEINDQCPEMAANCVQSICAAIELDSLSQ